MQYSTHSDRTSFVIQPLMKQYHWTSISQSCLASNSDSQRCLGLCELKINTLTRLLALFLNHINIRKTELLISINHYSYVTQ